jgi:cytochrome c biogenesis protein CcmG, thiol:disulfide interchange protein DsbE
MTGRVVAAALACCLLCACGTGGAPKSTGARTSAQASRPAASSGPMSDRASAARLDPCPQTTGAAARAGGLPDVTLQCLGTGPAVQLAGLRGRPMVLNLWATWCAPCRAEVGFLQSLHRSAGSRLRVLGVLELDRAGSGRAFAGELGLTYPSVVDADGTLRAPLRFTGLPQTLLVDADGRVTYRFPGPIRSRDQLDRLVADHLGVDS